MILVVDDELAWLEIARQELVSSGRGILCAATGPVAIKMLEEMKAEVSLALVDLNLGEVNGFTFIKDLHRLDPELPIIAISGFPGIGLESAIAFGANDVLRKPISPAWIATIRKYRRPSSAGL